MDPIPELLMTLPKKFRVIPVLFGAVLIHLSLGTYHTFGNMLPYLASYMRNRTDPEISIEDLMWIPTFQGCFPFAMVIGGFISSKIGPKAATFFGCAIMNGGVLLSGFAIKKSFISFIMTYGVMFGFGQGIAYVVAVSSVINWAPDSVGLFSGLVAGAFGVSAAIFTPLQTALINPENFVPDESGYFYQDILLDRIPHVFFILSSIYLVMQIIGIILICDPPQNIQKVQSGKTKIRRWFSDSVTEKPITVKSIALDQGPVNNTTVDSVTVNPVAVDSIIASPVTVDHKWKWKMVIRKNKLMKDSSKAFKKRTKNPRVNENDDVLVETDIEYSESVDNLDNLIKEETNESSMGIKEVLKSPTFYALFVTLFFCSFYGNLYYNLYKTFANTFIKDDIFMAVAFSVGTVANAVSRICWGILADKFSFQFALTIASSSATVLLVTMPYIKFGGKIFYFFWLILMFICIAANQSLFIIAAVKSFGPKHKAVNYGFLILSTTISGVLLSTVSQSLLSQIGYTWMFTAAAVFSFFALVSTTLTRYTPQGRMISIQKKVVKKNIKFVLHKFPTNFNKQFDTYKV